MDPVVLQYENIRLRRSDLSLLNGSHWLNDVILSFAFSYFTNDSFPHLSLGSVFIGPIVTELIKFSQDSKELLKFLQPLDLPCKQWIFLAVNNNSVKNPGGSHWSLLLFHRPSNKFIHYDSYWATNILHAWNVALKLHPFLACKDNVMLEQHRGPQQSNGYDCGMYVMYIAELLCEKAVEEKEPLIALQNITAEAVREKRADWLKRIQTLMAKSQAAVEAAVEESEQS